MGLDDDIYEGMQKRESHGSGPGASANAGSLSGPLLFPDDPNARQQVSSDTHRVMLFILLRVNSCFSFQ